MRVVFIGGVQFSVDCLNKMIEQGIQIELVLTVKTVKPFSDVISLKGICSDYGIACIETDSLNEAIVVESMRHVAPDLIVCIGWSKLLNTEILAIPNWGVMGYHPSLLPKNRGRHPLIWALALGLKETGSTFFIMDEGADTGDIVSQVSIAISNDDDADSLYKKMTSTAMMQLDDLIPLIKSGNIPRKPQNKLEGNSWRKRGIADGFLDWRMTSQSLYNLVRALSKPYPGAHFVFKGQMVKVWKVKVADRDDDINDEPGKVIHVSQNGWITVKTGDGALTLENIELEESVGVGEYLL